MPATFSADDIDEHVADPQVKRRPWCATRLSRSAGKR